MHCKNLLKTSWQDVLKMSRRSLQEVFKMYHQVKLFLLTCLGDVFNTFLRRTACKDGFFRQKTSLQMFGWIENRLLAKGLKYWAHSCSQLQIKPRKYSARKYVTSFLKKGERSWWDSKLNECLCIRHSPKVFFRIHKKHLHRNPFFDEDKLCNSARKASFYL